MGIKYLTRESPPLFTLASAFFWVAFYGYITSSSWPEYFLYLGFGVSLYTFCEWIIHGIIFHKIAKRMGYYYQLHGRHHKYPEQYERVVLPVAHQWLLVGIMTTLFKLTFFWIPLNKFWGIGSGTMMGYFFYEITHLYAHDYPRLKFLKFLKIGKEYHLYHHKCLNDEAFGFVSPVPDFFFNTDSKIWNFMDSKYPWFIRLPLPIPFYHWIVCYYWNPNIFIEEEEKMK